MDNLDFGQKPLVEGELQLEAIDVVTKKLEETATSNQEDDMTEQYLTTAASKIPILQFFTYEHLPPHLQEVSKNFSEAAAWMAENLPDGAELRAGLRKLLEAKDCAVRARLSEDPTKRGIPRDREAEAHSQHINENL